LKKSQDVKKDYGLFVLEIVAVLFILAYFYNLYKVSKNSEISYVGVYMFSEVFKDQAVYFFSRQENERCILNIISGKKYTLDNRTILIDDKNVSISSLLTQEYKNIKNSSKEDDYE